MKYIDEFRKGELAQGLLKSLEKEVRSNRTYRIMEFCGGHTHAIHRYGIGDLLPSEVELIHGPGCPVCVLPVSRLDMAITLAEQANVIFCTYADLMRVPASDEKSLRKAKAEGADVRMVYSTLDALQIARENPGKQVVFMAIGFETTTPPTAAAIKRAEQEDLQNFSVFCNHVLTPAALSALLSSSDEPVQVDGFIGPGHVSTVIGSQAYEWCAEKYGHPFVISGFEPLDIMQAILMLVRQLNEKRSDVEIAYSRAVSHEGNLKARALMEEVFDHRESFEWRGLGAIADSALKIKKEFSRFDAEKRFPVETFETKSVTGYKQCLCGEILRGCKKPTDCSVFGSVCTPENPLGACMVSAEGACAAYYHYGLFQKR